MKTKRGQGLPISTIILLILGIVILVFLIIGFTIGWSTFSSYFSKNNVKDVVSNCEIACSINSQYDYCSAQRDLTSDTEKLKQVTCNFLNQQRPLYAISGCSSVQCMDFVLVSSTDPVMLDGACNDPTNSGKLIYYLEKGVLKTYECAWEACPTPGDVNAQLWCSGKKLGDTPKLCLSAGSSSPTPYVCTAEDIK